MTERLGDSIIVREKPGRKRMLQWLIIYYILFTFSGEAD
jgi:hypothetical protein